MESGPRGDQPRKKVYKSGTEKRDEKRKRDLEVAARDPKQLRLFAAPAIQAAVLLGTDTGRHGNESNLQRFASTISLISATAPVASNSQSSSSSFEAKLISTDTQCQTSSETDLSKDEADIRADIISLPKEKAVSEEQFCDVEAVEASELQEAEAEVGLGQDNALNIQEISKFVPPLFHSEIQKKLAFMKQHPIQPTGTQTNLPFNEKKTYKRILCDKTEERRNWLSYCAPNSTIFCSVCMAFCCEKDRLQPFVIGYKFFKTKALYTALASHENSKSHGNAVIAYMAASKMKDIGTLINKDLMEKRKNEIEIYRMVVHRLIDIIVFIGRQGLAFRGSVETAADLDDRSQNHGNFLELVLLICKYDHILKNHVSRSIDISKKRRSTAVENKLSKGRGSVVTFLSKSFIGKLVNHLALQIQSSIVSEIKSAHSFSIEVDTTQDVAVIDQLALCVRYVFNGLVKVRLLKMLVATKTTGEALYQQLSSELQKLGLSTTHIVGCSFDGAANMSGQYNGVQAHLKKDNPQVMFVHCFAHALNLIMSDCTESCKVAKDFLGLLHNTAVFVAESHKRMLVWTTVNKEFAMGHQLLRRLQKIGATRWWSKDKALESVFDDINVPLKDCRRFLTLLKCLSTISDGEDFNSDVNFKAKSLLINWCRFETILVAFVFRDIFNSTTPTSKYFQTQGLDYLTASNMVKTLHSQLQLKRNNFDVIHNKTLQFAEHIQSTLTVKGYNIEIEQCLPEKRVKIAKRLDGELSSDQSRELATSPYKRFEIHVYNVIIDNAEQQIRTRFVLNDDLMSDIAMLDPRNFAQIQKWHRREDITDILTKVAQLANVNQHELCRELHQFSIHYLDYFKNPEKFVTLQDRGLSGSDSDHESADSNDDDSTIDKIFSCTSSNAKEKCNKCLVCTMKLLYELNLLGPIYPSLYIVYRYILTLSCTQVSCERVFSILKIIKSRLRSALTQDLLEHFILFYVERDFEFDYEKVIDSVAATSTELSRYLRI